MLQNQEWESFTGRLWKEECNVRDFIQNNYTQYDGDRVSLQPQQMLLTSFGISFRHFRRLREITVEF